jgi:adenylate cyclase
MGISNKILNRVEQLEKIITEIRDFQGVLVSITDFNELCTKAIKYLAERINANYGFLLMYERDLPNIKVIGIYGITRRIRKIPRKGVIERTLLGIYPIVINSPNDLSKEPFIKTIDIKPKSFLGVALIVTGELIGMIALLNKTVTPGFTTEDEELIYSLANVTAIAIKKFQLHEEKERAVISNYSRYFSTKIARLIHKKPEKLSPRKEKVTVLFADIRDFTPMVGRIKKEGKWKVLMERLRDFRARMSNIIHINGGIIDKFEGDSIMAVFGVPYPQNDQAERAVTTAIRMREALKELNNEWGLKENEKWKIGIGINTGEGIAGNIGPEDIGSEGPLEYTVLCDSVNIAARIVSEADKDEILIHDTTYEELPDNLKNKIEYLGKKELKGLPKKVNIWKVVK